MNILRLSRSQWLLLAILLIAAALRFQNLNAIEHNVDHAHPIWQALATLDRGVWPVTAQGTSVLFANPALTGYLLLPWVALTRSPIGPYLFVITLNTLAVWLTYRAAAMLLDERRALIAAFLMTVNPWVIEYSRTTWVQALMPFFACLVFWLLTPVLLGCAYRRRFRVILAFVALAAMTQTYLLAFLILAPVTALLVVLRRRIPWRAAAVGAGILAFTAGIYALGLAADGPETLARLREFASGSSSLSAEAWTHAVRLVSGQNYPVARGMDAPVGDWVLREYLSQAVHYVILAALLAGLAQAIYEVWRRWRAQAPTDAGLILLVWFAVPVLLMTYVSKPVHPFYLLLTLPAGYMLAAWGAGIVLRWRAGAAVLIVAAILAAVLMSLNTVRFAESTLAHPGGHQLGALPVGAGIEMAHALLPSDTRRPGAVVFADSDEWTLNSLAGSLFPVDRDLNVGQITYVPTGGATYLFFTQAGQETPLPVGATDSATFVLTDGTEVRRYRVLPDAVTELAGPIIAGDKGISYIGLKLEQPLQAGATGTLLTYWRVDDLQPDRGQWLFGPFAHVYDSTGKRVAVASGAVVPGARWRQGDIHIQRLSVAVPPDASGPFTVQIGQYDGVHNLNVMFALPDGTQAATIAIQPYSNLGKGTRVK
jgi:4-amino-4-deoxy-L-arabinose transferase-like glycosyltransferase